MTRGLGFKSIIVVIVLAALIGIYLVFGQASTQRNFGLVGRLEVSGKYLVAVHYYPDLHNPSCLGTVNLEFSKIGGEIVINQVIISVDHGNEWFECAEVAEHHWACDLSSAKEIIIKDFEELNIVVN